MRRAWAFLSSARFSTMWTWRGRFVAYAPDDEQTLNAYRTARRVVAGRWPRLVR
jgi:hypothetical protein